MYTLPGPLQALAAADKALTCGQQCALPHTSTLSVKISRQPLSMLVDRSNDGMRVQRI